MIDAAATCSTYCRGHAGLAASTRSRRWSRLESPTDDKAAVDRCGAELARRLAEIGGTRHARPAATAGNHLRAEFGSRPPADPAARALRHGLAGRPARSACRCRATAIGSSGPGVLDMKAGIALGMLATRALFELAPRRPTTRVVMLWTTDEETGSQTSRALLETEARAERGRARARAGAARRRAQDQPQGVRRVRDRRARRAGARRRRSGQGRQRHPRAGAPDPRRRDAAGSGARRLGQRRRHRRRHAARTSSRPRRAPTSTCARRSMADAERVDAAIRGADAASAGRTA